VNWELKAVYLRNSIHIYLERPRSFVLFNNIASRFSNLKVKIATLRARGKQQRFETLINEETLLLAKYIRKEKETWVPRIIQWHSI
jgi:hypothetical protein